MLILRLLCLAALLSVSGAGLRAQTPTAVGVMPAQNFDPGGAATTLDLKAYFSLPGVTGQLVQFDTILGKFNVELRADFAPKHVANFLSYVADARYAGSFFHRSAALESGANASSVSIVQGGGYKVSGAQIVDVPKYSAVPLEYSLPNARGTLAAARTSDVNSATSEWYFNVRDNTSILGQSNGGGYTVFGRVIGTGMSVVDQIAALPRVNAGSPFTDLPVRGYSGSGNVDFTNLVTVNGVGIVSIFPNGSGPSVLSFTADSSTPAFLRAEVSGTTLTLTPLSQGTGTVTVRATDTNGNWVENTVSFAVSAGGLPVIVAQPQSVTAQQASTVALNCLATGASSYIWRKGGLALPGATTATLVLPSVTAASAGSYSCLVANGVGLVQSANAVVAVTNAAPVDVGRLINLSVNTVSGSGPGAMTVGAVVGPRTQSESLPLVIRAVGPGLAAFGVTGVMDDPQLTLYRSGDSSPLGANDDWGGGANLAAAFVQVGAFPLPAGSKDAAIVLPAPGVAAADYSVRVDGKNDASGRVLAEIYDASGVNRTANSPRLMNVSVLRQIEKDGSLTAGFVIDGKTARTVLVRAVGPGLTALFGISATMADPKLELFNGSAAKIGESDNWGGDPALVNAATAVGAFNVTNAASLDAAMLITLAPGSYSARVAGVGGGGGVVIVEVYEVP
jgi:cyclophilin family peptidyl-prolyl cis-trans isomerase